MNPTTALWDEIRGVMEGESPADFFPKSKFETILTKDKIEATLQFYRSKLGGQSVAKLAKFIIDDAYPIFAAVVWMVKPWLITSFYIHEVSKEDMPIRYTDRGKRVEFTGVTVRGQEIDTMFRGADSAWIEADIEHFCQTVQWKFTAPVFKSDTFRYEFARQTILPFTTTPIESGHGGSGRVEIVTVHKDHINYTTSPSGQVPTHPTIALKTLQNGTVESQEEDAKKEAHNLEAVRALKSQHLIKAIGYYSLGSKHCFLFPLAEHKNLWYFWVARIEERRRGRSHRGDNKFLVWVFTQLVGIADAVAELHGDVPNIRHGDLKPENILCFQNGSCVQDTGDLTEPPIRMVITDVGISKGHQGPTQRRAVTSTVVSTARYEPPEMDQTKESPGHPKLSRRYDVWSLGCILLEFLIWLLYDSEGLLNFTNTLKERFYESNKKGPQIHPTVSQWIKKIKNDKTNCREGTPFRDLVVLIEEKLLVVKVETLPETLSEVAPTESNKIPLLRKLGVTRALRKTLTQQASDKFAEMVGRRRASAKDMRDELGKILEHIKRQKFEVKRGG